MNSQNSSAASPTPEANVTIHVELSDRRYPILIGAGILDSIGAAYLYHGLSATAVIITDTHIEHTYAARVQRSLKRAGCDVFTIVIPPGEKQKSFSRAEAIFAELLRRRVERSATIVAVGGGVVGDLAGFIAATYQRGVHFVQVPTTLLAQVDSSVGGKVAINHALGKNMIGAFYQPDFVFADVETLATLPQREIICGLGEVIKYGIIMNSDFYYAVALWHEKILERTTSTLQSIVASCCSMKAEVVAGDEREQGRRAILNFGHTIGHALEKAGGYRKLKHGEGVILGMLAESWIAVQLGLLPQHSFEMLQNDIADIPLPSMKAFPFAFDELYTTMLIDKKAKAGEVRMVLPTEIGTVNLPQPVDKKLVRGAIAFLQKYCRA
jgi:3-dehydroquinate synthase